MTAETLSSTAARDQLIDQLRQHSLIIGEVVLTSGKKAQYYVDVRRTVLQPPGFLAVAALVGEQIQRWGATAVGGLTMGADPIACAALVGGGDVKAFFVRKEVKPHGLSKPIEGPPLLANDRCLIVEDVVTTGGSTIKAIERVRDAGHEICGVVSVLDRLAGGAEKILAAVDAPYKALTTIDEIYPERPDK